MPHNLSGVKDMAGHAASHANTAKGQVGSGGHDHTMQPVVDAVNSLAEAVLNLTDAVNFLVDQLSE